MTTKFLLYELAVNSDVQQKLRDEIDEHHERYQGNIQYETLNHMKYLDMVISGNILYLSISNGMTRSKRNYVRLILKSV